MGANLLTKAWDCPACSREFIVASEATQDVCPWCNTTVEERSGKLEKASTRGADEQSQKAAPSGEPSTVDGYPYCLEASENSEEIAS